MLKLQNAAVLTDTRGAQAIRLTVAGDAVMAGTGEVVPLIEAQAAWVEGGGGEDEFDAAVGYVDSLR